MTTFPESLMTNDNHDNHDNVEVFLLKIPIFLQQNISCVRKKLYLCVACRMKVISWELNIGR